MTRIQAIGRGVAGLAVLALLAPSVAAAQSIAGTWRSSVEGTPSGMTSRVTSSDVQTMTLSAGGQYRRQITVEGGNGVTGAAGTIIDSGQYRFTPPSSFRYQRSGWLVCTYAGCLPGTPIGANAGTLPFTFTAANRATFLGLTWTKVQ